MRTVARILLLVTGFVAGIAATAIAVKRAVPSRGDADSDVIRLMAVFDGAKLVSRAQAFRSGSALAWFGGIHIDLRGARLAPGARLSVGALMGGITVDVPEHWRVDSAVRSLAGEVEVAPPAVDDPEAPTLMLDGAAVMGGIEVRRPVDDADR